MKHNQKISIFWFRRDLRLDDNKGLHKALKGKYPVLPIFIFDTEITNELDNNDARLSFIYENLKNINIELQKHSSSLLCKQGNPEHIWNEIINEYDIQTVYTNKDYEPYAIKRDKKVNDLLEKNGVEFHLYKDQVIYEKNEILKSDNSPYTVFTPYKNQWLKKFEKDGLTFFETKDDLSNLLKVNFKFPKLSELGFEESRIKVKDFNINSLDNYNAVRNFPVLNKTSFLSPHLRFGTVSIRKIVNQTQKNSSFLSELIWREFFMQILYHFPKVVHSNFRSKYDNIKWRNNREEFERWKKGETGYPMVDAGMRELNTTGYMHNRVRMVVASFLCKHLLIDWKWGEAYFAKKLLDFELSSNNGNWQWAAGTGCDAAPYFRIFNPTEQVKKFDSKMEYIKKWIPEINSLEYSTPIVEHKFARERAIEAYKKGIQLSMN